ncbi:hypothetical protein BY996DRAFT_6490159 [Phakopsora pachyrhizi]|nr:hypothetical protein BY996DRAFT_6490159 [Phakopsora pachyrhizi]
MVPLTPKSACKLQYEAHIGTLLEALSLLVTANVRISNCRLAEQAVPVVLHKQLTKKGKCKEKGNTTVTYPLVGLLALLDYDSLFKQPNLTEFITATTHLIKPSTNEKRKLKEVHTSHSDTPVQMRLSFSTPNPMKTPKSQQKRLQAPMSLMDLQRFMIMITLLRCLWVERDE